MTAFTVHGDTIFDVGKPILGSTGLEARDNLLAVTEGDPTAPRIAFRALERVVAGDSTRSNLSDTATPSAVRFSFQQIGTIKVTCTFSASDGVLFRYRNAVATQIGTAGPSIIATVDVLPGDTIVARSANGTTSVVLSTDGSNLMCANPSETVGVTGNDV